MHLTWVLLLMVAVIAAAMSWLLHGTRLGALLHEHIPDRPQRRLFLAAIGFFLTFAGVRTLTSSIHHNLGPFHDIAMGGRHIHHLVWGILLLLAVGYGWLVEVGTGSESSSLFMSGLMSLPLRAAPRVFVGLGSRCFCRCCFRRRWSLRMCLQ